MDDTLIYRKIELEELNLDLFRKFERRQNVARQLQKQGDAWVEKPVSLVEEWSREDYEFLLTCLQNTIQEGGVVFGAFEGNAVKGFASISGKPFGYAGTYRDSHKPSCLKRASGPGNRHPPLPSGRRLGSGHGRTETLHRRQSGHRKPALLPGFGLHRCHGAQRGACEKRADGPADGVCAVKKLLDSLFFFVI